MVNFCGYHGVPDNQLAPYRFATVEQYAVAWRETEDLSSRSAVLAGDADDTIMRFVKADGITQVYVLFVDCNTKSDKLNRESITSRLTKFLENPAVPSQEKVNIEGYTTGDHIHVDLKGGRPINNQLQLILYSEKELDGSPANEIARYNELIENPIKHITIKDLSFDPVLHKTNARSVRPLTLVEIRDFVEKQIGLRYAMDGSTLGEKYQMRIESAETESQRTSIRQDMYLAMLSTLPTININDPLVVWRGFKYQDILLITRRDKSIVIRRVIYPIDAKITKQKSKAATINK